MKKEILRIHNLNLTRSAVRKLTDITLCLMAGESTGLLGLANSGKDLLVELICVGEGSFEGSICIDGKVAVSPSDVAAVVYHMTASNFVIDDWTVAEYIGLVTDGKIFGMLRKKTMERNARNLLQSLHINMNVQKQLKELTETEKWMIDLAKAYSRQAKILVITDEFDGCTTEEIKQFKTTMDRIIKDKMAVIIDIYSEGIMRVLSDKYILFKDGKVVKKCNKNFVENREHLERFLLGGEIITKKKDLEHFQTAGKEYQTEAYIIKRLFGKNGEEMDFIFHKGEVTSILVTNQKEKERLFQLLSGRKRDRRLDIFLEGQSCDYENVGDFARGGIVSIVHMGNLDELLPDMSVGENLLVPSLKKISSFQYMMAENQLIKMLEKQVGQETGDVRATIRDMGVNERIVLILERWYVFRPRVLVLFEPFVQCDAYGVALVKSYIKKFAANGTAVVIVKSRGEYVEDISNQLIQIEC